MTKEKFLNELSKSILTLPKSDIDKILDYYSEIIDDYIENGLSEEEIIRKIGDVNEISNKIFEENNEFKPKSKLKKIVIFIFKIFNSKWRLLVFAALVFGFPIWFVILAPILIILFLAFICIFALPIFTLGFSVYWIWNPLNYSNLFNALYSVGLSIVAFGISTLYISIFTTFTKLVFKYFKKLFIKIKKLKFSKEVEK